MGLRVAKAPLSVGIGTWMPMFGAQTAAKRCLSTGLMAPLAARAAPSEILSLSKYLSQLTMLLSKSCPLTLRNALQSIVVVLDR
mmetsp:Transcript_23492/g.64749  ORF Transcript_23492/g.64749 Transcript_23492/m.64749 type:complete len:84 (-) Transcript_23492:3076-3327(-)